MASLKTSVRSLEALFCCHATFLNCDSDIVVFVLRMVIPFCRSHPLLTPPPPLHPLPLLLSKHVIFRGLDIFVFNQPAGTPSFFFLCVCVCCRQCPCFQQSVMQAHASLRRSSAHAAQTDGPGSGRHWRCGPMASSESRGSQSCKFRSRPKFR